VVLLITVVVLTALFVSVGGLFRADLKTSSGQIAASVRYLYNLSVMNNRAYRLVIDLESGTFWGEELDAADEACDAFLVEGDEDARPKKKARSVRSKRRGEGQPEDEEGAKQAPFAQVKDNLLTKRQIGTRIKFHGVITSHDKEPKTEGQAVVHFFPKGYVEHAYIYLGEEEDEDQYTIETRPLLGTAVVHRERLSENSFGDSDG
jgi:hypothetical protein